MLEFLIFGDYWNYHTRRKHVSDECFMTLVAHVASAPAVLKSAEKSEWSCLELPLPPIRVRFTFLAV